MHLMVCLRMTKSVSIALFSIHPQFAQQILCGKKKFEFRTKLCKRKITKMLIYATQPIGMIIGEAEVETMISEQPEKLWELACEDAGISKIEYDRYFAGRENACAYKLRNPVFYDSVIPLEYFGITHAPQSYCYIDKNMVD